MSDKKNIEALENYISELEAKLKIYEEANLPENYIDKVIKENFFNKIPVGVIIFESLGFGNMTQNKILDVNGYFEKISGISRENLLNKNITEIISDSQLPSGLFDDIFIKNKVIELNTSLINNNKHFLITFFKLNEKLFFAGFNDYTRLKEAEETILFERNLFQTLLNKFPDEIYFKDNKARFLRASLYMTQNFRTTPNEILGKTDFDFFSKPLAEKKFADDMNVIRSGIPIINKEEKGNVAGTETRWVSTTKLPLFNRKGEIEGMFGISRDITDKKLAEERQKEYKNNLVTLTESALKLLKLDSKQEIFALISKTLERQFKQSIVLYARINNTSEQQLEVSGDSHDHHAIKKVFDNNNFLNFLLNDEKIKELYFKGKLISCNQDLKDCHLKDEIKAEFERLNIKHKYILSITEGDKIVGIFMILMKDGIRLIDKNFVDTFIQQVTLIVHRKNLEEQLIIEKDRAEESDILKSSFLANLSHEIRTPINAIQGFGELLKIQDLSYEKKIEYIEIIQEKSSQLIQIIADIIDISKFESNQVRVIETVENLNEFLLNIVADFEYRISKYIKKDIPLFLIRGLEDNQSAIKTDFSLLKQVLANLITNSVKFTQYGIIELGYKVKDNELEFYVQDTGIGIPVDKREIIFERFRQVDESRTRKYGGTGLGLTISKSIIQLLNGRIWVESSKYEDFTRKDILNSYKEMIEQKEDFGSKLNFTIPYQPVKPEAPKEKVNIDTTDWSNKKILVVEDDSFNYHYIYEVLGIYNPVIIHCINGKDAVDYFQANIDNIDIILMDLQMPVMDGYEATKLIRNNSVKVPIIVQTAFSMTEDLNRAKEAGSTDFIIKPYNAVELIDKIAKYIA